MKCSAFSPMSPDDLRCSWPATIWMGPVPLCKGHYEDARCARERHVTADAFIYFARIGDYVKIGRSRNVGNRVRSLQFDRRTNRPADTPRGPLTLLHAEPAWSGHEGLVHEAFADDRVAGEWFRASSSLLAYIDSLRATPGVNLSGERISA